MSNHLENIVQKHEGVANLQILFIDIEKYSKRKTHAQNVIINKFTSIIKEALSETAQEYIEYIQKNDINLAEDTIIIPTGDGAAIVFSFDGPVDIPLEYAKALLKRVHEHNRGAYCQKFSEDGFCDCHFNFNVRIGVSEGPGLIYRDINNRFNAAGDVVNMAPRVMNLADRNQIILTEQAHTMLSDFVRKYGPNVNFIKYPQVILKHDVTMNVFQYVEELEYLNPAPLAIAPFVDPYSKERKLIEQYKRLEDSGFAGIYPNRQEFFNEFFGKTIWNFQEELKIMGICVSLFRESDRPIRRGDWTSSRTVEGIITSIIKRRCTVKILMLKRYLTNEECRNYGLGTRGDFYYMREHDEDYDYDFRSGKRLKIISNIALGKFIRVILELAHQTRDEKLEIREKVIRSFQIREYISLPSLSLYIADDSIYVTPYLVKRHCSSVPAFKVSGQKSELYAAYNGHFEAAWKDNDTKSAIDEEFIKLLISDPKNTIDRFEEIVKECEVAEIEKTRKSPGYREDPERYRVEEYAINKIIGQK